MFSYEEVVKASLNYFGGDALAATTISKKYFLRDGEKFMERDPHDMHDRLAREFVRAEMKMNPNLDQGHYYTKVRTLLDRFGKTVPQGSPMAGVGNPYQLQSLSNCVVIASPPDHIAGIFKSATEMAQLHKRRAGVGADLSNLRPFGARVNNAALTSGGVPCFADFLSYCTRMIGQKGRQGATMITLVIKHPDAMPFARAKQDLTKITGANISIRITDEFMRAVEEGKSFRQQWPVDSDKPEITQDVDARAMFNEIVELAWKTAEPGLLMWDNYTRNLPAHFYPGFETVSTNPCSELGLSAYDSCRLISQNQFGWIKNAFTKDAYFDFKEYYEDTKIAQRMSDGLVELELEIIERIIARSDSASEKALWDKFLHTGRSGRRTGLGAHALGDVFLALGMRYDSDEAVAFTDKLYETHKLASYQASIDMAKERGAFPVWNFETDMKCDFIHRLPADMVEQIRIHGRRNISNLTVAPTGTVAIGSRTSSGCEAVFRFAYDRYVKLTHMGNDFPVDRVDGMGDRWTKFRVLHPAAEMWLRANGIESPLKGSRDFSMSLDDLNTRLKKVLPEHFVTSDQIDPMKGVEIQAAITKHIDHGVSRTINLPKGSSVEAVHRVYMEGWKKGLKGITVYVDGSRDGVLVTEDKKPEIKTAEGGRPETIIPAHAPKRPKVLDAVTHHTKVRGEDWAVIVGLLHDKPYEVWAGKGLVLPRAAAVESATITRETKKRYSLKMKLADGEVMEIEDLKEIYESPEQRVITRAVCMELRHGIPVEFVVDGLGDYEGALTDYVAALARVLKKYVKNANLIAKSCPQCGGTQFEMKEGCPQCMACGWSKCS